MSGLANYLLEKGYNVSGSDSTQTEITDSLSRKGAKINYDQNGSMIDESTDLIIYTAAVKEDNEEYKKAKALNIKMVKRAVALGEIVNDDKLISISGTHGKTTTTSLTAKVFIDADAEPTVFVGGALDFLNGMTSVCGTNNIAIVEADEYDRSFHTLRSDIIIITNIEEDHLDYYKDLKDIKESFKKFIQNAKPGCRIIACGDDKNIRDLLTEFKDTKVMYYGFDKSNDNVISEYTAEEHKITFVLNNEKIEIGLKGKHNVLNSSAAFLAGIQCGLEADTIKKSLKSFGGVKRRLELKYTNSVNVYDDYAHHPTEIKATLEALRSAGAERIITIFQPHLFSRTRDFYKDFAHALSGTDVLILNKIYPAREKAIEGVTSEMIRKEIPSEKETYYIEENKVILEKLNEIKKNNDTIVFMGAGNITDICNEYVNSLKN